MLRRRAGGELDQVSKYVTELQLQGPVLTLTDSPVMINKIMANFFQQLEESEPDLILPLVAGSSYSPKSTTTLQY